MSILLGALTSGDARCLTRCNGVVSPPGGIFFCSVKEWFMRRVLLAGLAVIGVVVLAIPAAFARPDTVAADPGISARTITIGGTYPLSGPVASYGAIAVG